MKINEVFLRIDFDCFPDQADFIFYLFLLSQMFDETRLLVSVPNIGLLFKYLKSIHLICVSPKDLAKLGKKNYHGRGNFKHAIRLEMLKLLCSCCLWQSNGRRYVSGVACSPCTENENIVIRESTPVITFPGAEKKNLVNISLTPNPVTEINVVNTSVIYPEKETGIISASIQ